MTAKNSSGYEAPIGLAADPVIFTLQDEQLSVLLIERHEDPDKGKWSLPGGFVGTTESPEQTVNRKLNEKTGMDPIYVEQLRTYARPDRDRRGWLPSVAYLSLIPAQLLPDQDENGAKWHAVDDLPRLAFDHKQMIEDGLERLRGKLWYSNIAIGLLPQEFTLSQARAVYEAIAGKAYDPGNFARDLKNSGLITEAEGTRAEGRGRPAQLFKFVSREAAWSPRYAKGTR
jgi:8-oxo-dGTP diphosphatase